MADAQRNCRRKVRLPSTSSGSRPVRIGGGGSRLIQKHSRLMSGKWWTRGTLRSQTSGSPWQPASCDEAGSDHSIVPPLTPHEPTILCWWATISPKSRQLPVPMRKGIAGPSHRSRKLQTRCAGFSIIPRRHDCWANAPAYQRSAVSRPSNAAAECSTVSIRFEASEAEGETMGKYLRLACRLAIACESVMQPGRPEPDHRLSGPLPLGRPSPIIPCLETES
jgi:hypothetical protein